MSTNILFYIFIIQININFFFRSKPTEYILNLDEMRDIKISFNTFLKFINSEYNNLYLNFKTKINTFKTEKGFINSEKLKYINENMNDSKLSNQSFYDIWKKFLNKKS